MLLSEFFDGIREDLGGSTETTLTERWPDKRLFGYLKRFMGKLSVDVPLAQDPTATAHTEVDVGAGDSFVPLGFEPARLQRVQVLSGSQRRVLAPTTQEAILYERDQNPGMSAGTPAMFAVAPLSDGTTGVLLHPPSAGACKLEVWYWPLVALEDPAWTPAGALPTPDPGDDPLNVLVPALFIDAAQEWCLWRAMRSAEDFDMKERLVQEKRAEDTYQRALGDYNSMVMDQGVILSPWISPLI